MIQPCYHGYSLKNKQYNSDFNLHPFSSISPPPTPVLPAGPSPSSAGTALLWTSGSPRSPLSDDRSGGAELLNVALAASDVSDVAPAAHLAVSPVMRKGATCHDFIMISIDKRNMIEIIMRIFTSWASHAFICSTMNLCSLFSLCSRATAFSSNLFRISLINLSLDCKISRVSFPETPKSWWLVLRW